MGAERATHSPAQCQWQLEIFIIGTNGQLNHAWENTAGNSTSWTGFSTFSSALTQTIKIGGGTNANGALDIFVVGTDGVLYEMHQTTPGGSWSAWPLSEVPGPRTWILPTAMMRMAGRKSC